MAFAYKGSGGTAASSALNQSTITITTTTTAGAVGDLLVLCLAVDNNAITDGDENAITSITSPGNIWLKAKEFTNGQAAIQAGATCSLWFCNLLKPIPIGTVITINFGDPPARDASAISLAYFTEAVNYTGVVTATNSLANDAMAAGSLDATTTTMPCLRIRATASESNSTVAWVKTAAFNGLLPQAVTNSGGGAVNQGIRGEYCISTGTGSASLPTGGAGGATDHASIYVAFYEVPTQFLTPALYNDAGVIFDPISMLYFYPGLLLDNGAIYASSFNTNNSFLPNYTYNDADSIFASTLLRGDIVLGTAPIVDAEEILDVVVINNVPSMVGFYEDEDIVHRAEISSIWIVLDDIYDDADEWIDAEVVSINYIPHSVISFDTIIEPVVVSQTQAISSGMDDVDHIFGSDSQSTSGFGPGYEGADDSFFMTTFGADTMLAPLLVAHDDVIQTTSVVLGAAPLQPSLFAADDIIYVVDGLARMIFPAHSSDTDNVRVAVILPGAVTLTPARYIDADKISAPLFVQHLNHTTPYRDPDAMIPPFIGQRRYVRSNAGVIKGTIDKVSLIGNRDEDLAA